LFFNRKPLFYTTNNLVDNSSENVDVSKLKFKWVVLIYLTFCILRTIGDNVFGRYGIAVFEDLSNVY